MDEMARHYIGLLERANITGSILLGGWSLGGYLSLAIARILADTPRATISVAGLVLIDSPYHVPWSTLPPDTSDLDIGDVPALVQKAFELSDAMLEFWTLPDWDGPSGGGQTVHLTVEKEDFAVNTGHVLYRPLTGGYQLLETKGRQQQPPTPAATKGITPPPGIIIRCVRPTPTKDTSHGLNALDIYREDPMLGWDREHPIFLKAVFDVDAHHFDVFGFDKTALLSQHLDQGLKLLDSLSMPEMY
nr:hypothetical protein CFP56_79558 [Quercus suber]